MAKHTNFRNKWIFIECANIWFLMRAWSGWFSLNLIDASRNCARGTAYLWFFSNWKIDGGGRRHLFCFNIQDSSSSESASIAIPITQSNCVGTVLELHCVRSHKFAYLCVSVGFCPLARRSIRIWYHHIFREWILYVCCTLLHSTTSHHTTANNAQCPLCRRTSEYFIKGLHICAWLQSKTILLPPPPPSHRILNYFGIRPQSIRAYEWVRFWIGTTHRHIQTTF